VSRRYILVGTAWVVLQSAVAAYNSFHARGASLGRNLPLAPLGFLVLIPLPVNGLVRRRTGWHGLGGGELGTVWIMTAAACVMPLRGVVAFLVPLLASPLH
jgi:hypothetical protein